MFYALLGCAEAAFDLQLKSLLALEASITPWLGMTVSLAGGSVGLPEQYFNVPLEPCFCLTFQSLESINAASERVQPKGRGPELPESQKSVALFPCLSGLYHQ